jgi:hypothetical protein
MHKYNFLGRRCNTIRVKDCKEEKISNKVLNRFKKVICGKIHANNQKTFKRRCLD